MPPIGNRPRKYASANERHNNQTQNRQDKGGQVVTDEIVGEPGSQNPPPPIQEFGDLIIAGGAGFGFMSQGEVERLLADRWARQAAQGQVLLGGGSVDASFNDSSREARKELQNCFALT